MFPAANLCVSLYVGEREKERKGLGDRTRQRKRESSRETKKVCVHARSRTIEGEREWENTTLQK